MTATVQSPPLAGVDAGPLVECRAATRTYGSGNAAVVAVHKATCSVAPRARVALTGWSGSGKSTLLHMLGGLEAPTAGSVTWPLLGAHPRSVPGWVGVVFQGPSLVPALDSLENVALPLLLAGRPQPDAYTRAADALAELGLSDIATKLPDELSGGQAQRVAIARVLAGEARLILADEPTGQLDQESAERAVRSLITAADRLNAALVLATHDSSVASQLSTWWSMQDGQLDTVTGVRPEQPLGRRP